MLTTLNPEATPTVCLIEGQVDVRRVIELMLQQRGYWVCTFENHDKALSVLPIIRFNVLICCSSPRKISCDEFAKEAKALQPNTPVIVATSNEDYLNLEKYEAIDAVIKKPFTLQELDDVVQFLLRKANA